MKNAIVPTIIDPPPRNYKVKTDIFRGRCIECGKISDLTHPYCVPCLEILYHIRVKKTKDRGYGVFLLKSCKEDSLMFIYTGHVIDKEEYNQVYDDAGTEPDYGFAANQRCVIDNRSNFYSVARYVNGTTSEHSNIRFARTPKRIALEVGVSIYAEKNIYVPPGKEVELLLDYGELYDGIREVVPKEYIAPKGYIFPKLRVVPCYGNTL